MAWTNMSFPFGSVLTSAQMTNLYDDITAQANGDTGAPKQQTAGIASNEQMTTANVNGAIAGSAVGAVGTYAFCKNLGGSPVAVGGTTAGSNLQYGYGGTSSVATPTLAGTWRAMGYGGVGSNTVYLRIA